MARSLRDTQTQSDDAVTLNKENIPHAAVRVPPRAYGEFLNLVELQSSLYEFQNIYSILLASCHSADLITYLLHRSNKCSSPHEIIYFIRSFLGATGRLIKNSFTEQQTQFSLSYVFSFLFVAARREEWKGTIISTIPAYPPSPCILRRGKPCLRGQQAPASNTPDGSRGI